MTERNFRKLLEQQWANGNFVCVGLDSKLEEIPESAHTLDWNGNFSISATIAHFNRRIIAATQDLVCAYKPNMAFYEARGVEAISALKNTIHQIHLFAPDVPVILDAKRADIGNTNLGYVEAAFDYLEADAITVHPYLGSKALEPFLSRTDKGIFVLCRTSNPGAGEFQDLMVTTEWSPEGTLPLYQYIAMRVVKDWNDRNNCGLVVGATYPDELADVRALVGDMPLLIPGIGTQGGDIEKTVKAGKDSQGKGMIINSSRGIIFASRDNDFDEAARRETQKLNTLVNKYRSEA